MHWIIRHAAYLRIKFHVGAGGLPGCQRLHGKSSSERIAKCGEHVLFYIPKRNRARVELRWRHGFVLGRAWHSDSNCIAMASGQITMARTMRRAVLDKRWCGIRVGRASGTPIAQCIAYLDRIE